MTGLGAPWNTTQKRSDWLYNWIKKHTHTHNGKWSATDWPFQSPHFNIMEVVWGHHDEGYNKKAANIQRTTNIPQENLKKLQKNLPIFGLYTVFLYVYTCQCEYVHEKSHYKCTSCSLNMCNFARNSYFKKRRKYISIANFLLGFVFVHHGAKADLCVCLFSYRCAFLTVLRSYEENSTSLALNVSKKTMNESHLSSSLVWKLQQSQHLFKLKKK